MSSKLQDHGKAPYLHKGFPLFNTYFYLLRYLLILCLTLQWGNINILHCYLYLILWCVICQECCISFLLLCKTDYHKTNGLKQHKFIFLQFYRLEVWHDFYWAEVKVLASLHFFLEFFQLLRPPAFFDSRLPSSVHKTSNITSPVPFFHCLISPWP